MKFPFFRSKPVETVKPVEAKTGLEVMRPSVVLPGHAKVLRESTETNRKMLRDYDAAITTNLNSDFRSTIGSANAEILTSLYVARGRARTLTKDTPHGKAILRVYKNNVCGEDPFRLEMKLGEWSADGKTFTLDTKLNRQIEEAWEEAGLPENCTVRRDMSRMELYQTVEASALRDGSILARHWRGFPNNKFNYAIELIDSDRLQESFMGRSSRGNPIRFSIERDRWNAPLTYYILTRHPGDLFQYNNVQSSNTWREEVDADDIIHFNNLRDRAEQDIGFPEFDSIIQQLHRDRQFDVAHVTAAIWSACKPFFIIQEYPTGAGYAGDPSAMMNQIAPGGVATGGGGGNNGNTGDKVKMVEPATGEILNFGQKPMMLDPRFPIESAAGFKKDNLRASAIGAGLAYHSVSNDYEGLSFSASRAAETPQRDNFKVRQQNMINCFVRKNFNEWLKYAILTGSVPIPFDRYEEAKKAAVFHGKRWPYVNPLQDAETDIMLIEAGLKSPQEVRAESGNERSIEDIYADIASAEAIAKSHGLDFTSEDPTVPTVKKGEPNQLQPKTATTATE